MPLDLAILIILAIFLILGFKNGFAHTVFFALGWIISFAVAFFTRVQVRTFLTDNTPVYEWYRKHVYELCMKFISGYTDKFADGLPGADGLDIAGISDIGAATGGAPDSLGAATSGALDSLGAGIDAVSGGALNGALESIGGALGGTLGDALASAGEKLAQEAAEQIVSASFGVFSFIATVLVVKLFLFLITLALSRKYHGGFVGALDATGGLFIGLAQGFIVVFIMLILIMPVTLAISPELFTSVAHALDTSFIAKTLFTSNPLVPFVDGFAPGLFDPNEWLEKLNQITR
jgi:uncharacterized membrane protein required for colicin V production